jgi:gliding motility-associated lipoprotein GldH
MSRRKHKVLLCLTVAVALAAMASCSRRPVYSHYEAIGQEGWHRTDTLRFTCPIRQAGQYRLRLGLRASTLYPFTQLTLIARHQMHKSRGCHADTLTLDITDHEGNINGEGVSIHQYEVPLTTVNAARCDTLRIDVFHGMTRQLLPGICDVGITVENPS